MKEIEEKLGREKKVKEVGAGGHTTLSKQSFACPNLQVAQHSTAAYFTRREGPVSPSLLMERMGICFGEVHMLEPG